MFTAKVQTTEDISEGLRVYVDFYNDGVFSHTENVIPQDRQGFLYWKESRLKSLNTRLELKPELTTGKDVTQLTDDPALTQEEIDKQLWLKRDALKTQVDIAIEKGYILATNPKVVQLNTWLKNNFKPEYLGLI